MGLLKAYAIYQYGKKKGTRKYEEAVLAAKIEVRQEAYKKAVEDQMREKCLMCGHKYMQHDDNGCCPVYPEA
jgi:hypothetical protein